MSSHEKNLASRVARLAKRRKDKPVDTKRLKDLADSLRKEAKFFASESKKKQFYGTANDLAKCARLYKKGLVTVTQVRRVEKDAEAKLGHRREADRLRQRRHRAGEASTSLFGYENCDSVLEKGVKKAIPELNTAKNIVNAIADENCGDDTTCSFRALMAMNAILDGIDKMAKYGIERENKRGAARNVQKARANEAYRKRLKQDENTHQRIKAYFESIEKK